MIESRVFPVTRSIGDRRDHRVLDHHARYSVFGDRDGGRDDVVAAGDRPIVPCVFLLGACSSVG